MAIRILLVEDELSWQQGVEALLSMEDDMQLMSVVDNADDADVFFAAEQPDIVLIDWKIRGPRDGMELAASLQQHISCERLILVTGSPPEQIPPHPYGYVPKPRIGSELVDEIRKRARLPREASSAVG